VNITQYKKYIAKPGTSYKHDIEQSFLFVNQLNVFFNEQHEDKHKSLPIVQISSIKYFMVSYRKPR